jgi:vancomycin resistance protein YoaR
MSSDATPIPSSAGAADAGTVTDVPTRPLFTFDPADDDTVAGHGRGRGIRRFFVAFLIGLLAVMAIGAGGLYAYDRQYDGRVRAGVRVGGIDLSGLSPAAAKERLNGAFGAAATGELVFHTPDGATTVTYAELGRHVDVDELVAEAMAIGHGSSPIERVIGNARTALRGVTLEPRIVFDTDILAAKVEAVAASQDRVAKDSTVAISKSGFSLAAGTDGRVADRSTPFADALSLLGRLDSPSRIDVDIPVQTVEPTTTTAEATAARDAAQQIARKIVLGDGQDSWTIGGRKVHEWLRFAPTLDGGYAPVVKPTSVTKAIKTLAKKVDRDAVSASFLVGKGKQIVGVTASKNGRKLDVKKTAAAVLAELQSRGAGAPAAERVAAVVNVRTPRLTTEEARKAAPLMERISTWTTYFPISERNNFGANIWLPAKFIDGTVVAPGETFDFWKVVGPVTRERGFGLGGAIIDGHTEPQGALAGGICSCSTTLFNAALRAGMHMQARRNHFYYIDRYPLGLDATVFISASGATQTMSWTNDTKYPVLIRGIRYRVGLSGYVRFDLYSVPNNRKVIISAPTVRNVRRATTIYQNTSSLPKGTSEQVEFPVDGRDVWRTVTVKQGDRVISRRTYYSHYSVINGLILIGTG